MLPVWLLVNEVGFRQGRWARVQPLVQMLRACWPMLRAGWPMLRGCERERERGWGRGRAHAKGALTGTQTGASSRPCRSGTRLLGGFGMAVTRQ